MPNSLWASKRLKTSHLLLAFLRAVIHQPGAYLHYLGYIPLLFWVTTLRCDSDQGEATVHNVEEIPQEIQKTLLRGLELDQKEVSRLCIMKVNPRGDFLTYGVGVSLLTVRYPEKSQGRILV